MNNDYTQEHFEMLKKIAIDTVQLIQPPHSEPVKVIGGFAIDLFTMQMEYLPKTKPSDIDFEIPNVTLYREFIERLENKGYKLIAKDADLKWATFNHPSGLTDIDIHKYQRTTPFSIKNEAQLIIASPKNLEEYILARTDRMIMGREARPIDYERVNLLTKVMLVYGF